MRHPRIFSGNSNRELALQIVGHLQQPLLQGLADKFSNNETQVIIRDSIRDSDVYVIQSSDGYEGRSINDGLMELMILISACRLASARKVTAVVPYFPYSTHCKLKSRGCVTSKLVANMLLKSGASRVITVDLHASQIQGFFTIPIDNFSAQPVIADFVQKRIPDYKNSIIVAKNPGGTKRATSLADMLNIEFTILQPLEGAKAKSLLGDVEGRTAIVVDDMLKKLATFAEAASLLKSSGVAKVYIIITHCFVTSDMVEQIASNNDIDYIVCTNTVGLPKTAVSSPKFITLDISELLAEAIRRTHNGESVSELYRRIPGEV